MNKIFLIIIEPGLLDATKHAKMIEALKNDPSALNWWHHITNTYIVVARSNVTVTSFQKFIKSFFNDSHFLVLEIPKINRYEGWLPEDAWTWIQKNASR